MGQERQRSNREAIANRCTAIPPPLASSNMEDANLDDAVAEHALDGPAEVLDGRHIDQT